MRAQATVRPQSAFIAARAITTTRSRPSSHKRKRACSRTFELHELLSDTRAFKLDRLAKPPPELLVIIGLSSIFAFRRAVTSALNLNILPKSLFVYA